MHLKKILNNSNRKPNKIWVDQGSEFYNNAFKDFLKINNIKMYSTCNKYNVVAEKFIRNLKNKIFKHMSAFSKNVYFDVLDDIVNKYNNTVHRTINIKPTDIMGDFYVESNKNAFNKVSMELVTMLEFQNIKTFLLKDILQIGLKKFLLLVKLKIQFHGHMLLMISMVKKLLEHFMKKNYRRLIKNNLE